MDCSVRLIINSYLYTVQLTLFVLSDASFYHNELVA